MQPTAHNGEVAGKKLMENRLDGRPEGVFPTKEGSFVWKLGRSGFAGSVISSSRGGRFKDIKCEAKTLERTRLLLKVVRRKLECDCGVPG